MGFLTVNSVKEEEVMLSLLPEFSNRVILPRDFKPTQTFKEFAGAGVYGIVEAICDKDTLEALYEIALPDHYIGFLRYLIDKEISKKPVINEEELVG